MNRSARLVAAALLAIASAAGAQRPQMSFRLPHPAPPRLYGTMLISRASTAGESKPVVFAHWKHRVKYTCRVCHLELDFAFRANETPITEKANREGAYCGACHNGRAAFGLEGQCARCHTGTTEGSDNGFKALMELPSAEFGNRVDWTRALSMKLIAPLSSLTDDAAPIQLDRTLSLEADWSFVPPAVFPHGEHERWLDCSNCHPSIFNVKKKTTAHFTMTSSLRGEFCGVCHLRVAFPLNDCRRCHPTMEHQPEL